MNKKKKNYKTKRLMATVKKNKFTNVHRTCDNSICLHCQVIHPYTNHYCCQ